MPTELHRVDHEKCKGDGICAEVCVRGVLEMHEGMARTAEGREVHCVHCAQCAAVCPNAALEVTGLAGAEVVAKSKWKIEWADFVACLEARRATRNFAERPVDRKLVEQVIEAASLAPPGCPPSPVEIIVVDDKAEIERLAGVVRAAYGKLLGIWSNPIGRTIIGLRRGAETKHAIASHVIPVVEDNEASFERTGADRYLHGAPVLMLFHACRWVAAYEESALIAATYAMLAAHVLGLGATMLSIVPPIFNNMGAELRPRYGIPDDNKVAIAVILGHPKYKYRRAVRRPLKSVRFLGEGR